MASLLGLITVPDWLLLLIIISITYYVYYTWNFGTFEAMGIPYQRPWPILGNFIPEIFAVVHLRDLKQAKKYGGIYGFFESRVPALRISDVEAIRDICVKEFSCFTDRRCMDMSGTDPIFNLFLTVLRGDEWKRTRNVMTPTFTSGKLKQMLPLIEKCGQRLGNILCEKVEKGENIEIKSIYQAYLMEVIATCVFGIEINAQCDKNDQFMKYANKLVFNMKMIFFFILLMVLPEFIQKRVPLPVFDVSALQFFKNLVLEVLSSRQATAVKRNDFIQLMIDALKTADMSEKTDKPSEEDELKVDVKKVLTPDGVVAQSVLFLLGGFETTATSLSFVTYALATNPECQEKLIKEIDDVIAENNGRITYESISKMQYMDMVISEALRIYPPALRIERMCTKDCTIKGVRIPKGMMVVMPVYPIHFDEQYYDNPTEFDPERFSPEKKDTRNPFTYLVFGIGPRNCIGMRFALMEMKATLAYILRDYRIVCAPETKVPIEFKKGIPLLMPKKPIELKLERRT